MAEAESPDASYYGINVHPDLIYPRPTAWFINRCCFRSFSYPHPLSFFSTEARRTASVSEAFSRILQLSEKPELPGRELLIQSALLAAWPGVLNIVRGSGTAVSASENQRLKEILLYLNGHYSEKITLEAIASHIHLSPGECSRFFRRATGMTLFSYLLQHRIRRAGDCFPKPASASRRSLWNADSPLRAISRPASGAGGLHAAAVPAAASDRLIFRLGRLPPGLAPDKSGSRQVRLHSSPLTKSLPAGFKKHPAPVWGGPAAR